ncbi:MAG TPA: NAD(P)H-binding protein [Myxococcaceae bacterium]|nr:NAD(P)H-binding protein [Myxococcaceae bacterium]
MQVPPVAQRTVLVLGARGTVGSEVTRALLGKDARVRVYTRSSTGLNHLPDTVERLVGDVGDAAGLRRAVDGVASVFYSSPHEADEVRLAENVVEACEAAGARLVFVGVHADGPNRLERALKRRVFSRYAPHYREKLVISERVRRSRANPVVLMPSNFIQNDELFREQLLEGIFSQPLGHKGHNRVDVRDIGDAAARAMLDPSIPSGTHPVFGPASFSGPACAAVWSAALGREVRYTGDDARTWERPLREQLSGRKQEDFLQTYRIISTVSTVTDPRIVERTTQLLGHPPRGYGEYVREAISRWRGAGRREPHHDHQASNA